MSEEKKWFLQRMAEEAVEALKKNGFDAAYLPNRSALLPKLENLIPAGASVGFGGSRTLVECGVFNWLREADEQERVKLFDRDEVGISAGEKTQRMKASLIADYFFSGINGIGLDGSLVFIDGYGNRVAPILFGPGNVILVSGANKVTASLEAAMKRAKEVAAPLNAFRLNRETPCAKTGHCQNCRSAQRICNYTVTLEKDPYQGRIKIFLIGEELGL